MNGRDTRHERIRTVDVGSWRQRVWCEPDDAAMEGRTEVAAVGHRKTKGNSESAREKQERKQRQHSLTHTVQQRSMCLG